jgi:putative methyltransferase (TIGR04325 family)
MRDAKATLKLLTPPIIWEAARRIARPERSPLPLFEGPLSSWASATENASNWDDPEIVQCFLTAALKVRDGRATFERDGIPYDQIIYSPAILAFLLLAISRHQALHVVDIGGALGSNYLQNVKLIRHSAATSINWHVVERPALVKIGVENFQTAELSFFDNVSDAMLKDAVVLFSGSLQYLDEPLALLAELTEQTDIIGLDRVVVSPSAEHATFVMHPNFPPFPRVSFPTWCFSRDALVKWFGERGFALVEHFTQNPQSNFDVCGMLFART